MSLWTLPAPAKINLFLHVIGRRADGYHELQSVFQLLDFCDDVQLALRADSEIKRNIAQPGFDETSDLSLRAARLLQAETGCRLGCEIGLHKRIPAGAGLGGGSSDAATVLLALNKLWRLGLGIDELARLGLRLGADVPVFVHGHSAFAEGIGEKLTPMPLGESWYVLVFPGQHVPTQEIFQSEELTRNTAATTIPRLREGAPTRNDLEPVAIRRYPEIGAVLEWLKPFGPARMSGSGSSVFLRVDSREHGERILSQIPSRWRAWCVRGIDRSPLMDALSALPG